MMSSGTMPKTPMTIIAGATRLQRVRIRCFSRSACTLERRPTVAATVISAPNALVLQHARRPRRHVDADAVADGEMRLAAQRIGHAHVEPCAVGEADLV